MLAGYCFIVWANHYLFSFNLVSTTTANEKVITFIDWQSFDPINQ